MDTQNRLTAVRGHGSGEAGWKKVRGLAKDIHAEPTHRQECGMAKGSGAEAEWRQAKGRRVETSVIC